MKLIQITDRHGRPAVYGSRIKRPDPEGPFLVVTLEGAKQFDNRRMAELYATLSGGIVVEP